MRASSTIQRIHGSTSLQSILPLPFGQARFSVGLQSSISFRGFSTQNVTNDDEEGIYAAETIPETGEWAGCSRSFLAPIRINARGADTLYNPLFNKGTAFKSGERDRLRIRGLLPHRMTNIALQKERFLVALRAEPTNIQKNMRLEDLHDRNETLYHRVLVEHMDEMAPLIYTPTVGQACTEFGARFRRPRGMYFTPQDRGNMAAMVRGLHTEIDAAAPCSRCSDWLPTGV